MSKIVKFSMEFNIERIYKAIKLYTHGDITLPYKYLNYYFKKQFDARGLSWCQNHLDYELGEDAEFTSNECDRIIWQDVMNWSGSDDLEEFVEKVLLYYIKTKQNHLPKRWKKYLDWRKSS